MELSFSRFKRPSSTGVRHWKFFNDYVRSGATVVRAGKVQNNWGSLSLWPQIFVRACAREISPLAEQLKMGIARK